MTSLPVLYHKGKKGAIYQWRVWTEGADVVSEHGQYPDGEKMTARRTVTAKNVGRSNATTPEVQAEIEAKSDWKFKRDRKYVESLDDVHKRKIAVMLAPNDKWEDTKKYAKYPAHVQPKLNGARCLAYWEGDRIVLMSRGGKEWDLPHITEQLRKCLPYDAYFDGELYRHGIALQTILSWIKKHYQSTLTIGFHVYDIPVADGEEKLSQERMQDLERLVPMGEKGQPHPDTPNIFRVYTFEVQDETQVDLCEESFVQAGYEGSMFRNQNADYDWGHRSRNLLKRKRFQHAEFKVVGFRDASGGHSGCVIWICTTKDGEIFDVVPDGSLKDRAGLFLQGNEYIGRMLTVRFKDYSEAGKPLIAKGEAFRPSEDLDAVTADA